MITENYYYKNRVAVIATAKKHGVDWGVAVSMYDNEHGTPKNCDAARQQFYAFVRGKRFDAAGNITGFSKMVDGKDTFIDRIPTSEELAELMA